MKKININIDIKNDVEGYDVDLVEMESKCSVFEICDSFVRLSNVDENIFAGLLYTKEGNKEIRINTKTNTAYVDYDLIPMKDLIALFTDLDEISFLERCFDLNRIDFACRAYLKNGTIAFKDLNGQWYKFEE